MIFDASPPAIILPGEPWQREVTRYLARHGVSFSKRQDIVREIQCTLSAPAKLLRPAISDLEAFAGVSLAAMIPGVGASAAVAGGSGGEWQTAWSGSLTTNTTGFSGWTTVARFEPALFSFSGSMARLRVSAHTTSGTTINHIFFGHAAASGDDYDFDGSQVEQLFGGSQGITLSAAQTVLGDDMPFTFDHTKAFLVAISFGASAIRRTGNLTNISSYQRNLSNDAGTTDKSSYSNATGVQCVDLIEVFG